MINRLVFSSGLLGGALAALLVEPPRSSGAGPRRALAYVHGGAPVLVAPLRPGQAREVPGAAPPLGWNAAVSVSVPRESEWSRATRLAGASLSPGSSGRPSPRGGRSRINTYRTNNLSDNESGGRSASAATRRSFTVVIIVGVLW